MSIRSCAPITEVEGIGEFPEVTDAAAAVPAIPGVIDRVMEHGGNSYLFEVTSRAEPTDAEWKTAQKDFIAGIRPAAARAGMVALSRFIEGYGEDPNRQRSAGGGIVNLEERAERDDN